MLVLGLTEDGNWVFGRPVGAKGYIQKITKTGDPGWIRTSDPQLRRLVLYPAELRGLAWLKVYPPE